MIEQAKLNLSRWREDEVRRWIAEQQWSQGLMIAASLKISNMMIGKAILLFIFRKFKRLEDLSALIYNICYYIIIIMNVEHMLRYIA